jgi:hypothetical protein
MLFPEKCFNFRKKYNIFGKIFFMLCCIAFYNCCIDQYQAKQSSHFFILEFEDLKSIVFETSVPKWFTNSYFN